MTLPAQSPGLLEQLAASAERQADAMEGLLESLVDLL